MQSAAQNLLGSHHNCPDEVANLLIQQLGCCLSRQFEQQQQLNKVRTAAVTTVNTALAVLYFTVALPATAAFPAALWFIVALPGVLLHELTSPAAADMLHCTAASLAACTQNPTARLAAVLCVAVMYIQACLLMHLRLFAGQVYS
jgi:hypothetical protein